MSPCTDRPGILTSSRTCTISMYTINWLQVYDTMHWPPWHSRLSHWRRARINLKVKNSINFELLENNRQKTYSTIIYPGLHTCRWFPMGQIENSASHISSCAATISGSYMLLIFRIMNFLWMKDVLCYI